MIKQWMRKNGGNNTLLDKNFELLSSKEIIQRYRDCFGKKALILLEHEKQIKDCLQWIDEIKVEKQIIALSPFAMFELDKHKICYRIPEDYYQPKELYHVGMENYQKAENLSIRIDQAIHSACPILANLGIKPAWFSIHDLKALYDVVILRLLQLSKIIKTEEPDIIFVYNGQYIPLGIYERTTPYLWFDNRESIYAHLLGLDGWGRTVVILPCIPESENSPVQRNLGNILASFRERIIDSLLKRNPDLFEILRAIKKRNWEEFKKKLKNVTRLDKETPVVSLEPGYNWTDCRDELNSAGIGPIFRILDNPDHWLMEPLPSGMELDALESTWEQLQSNNQFREFFLWKNIDFFPVAKKRLRFMVKNLALACLKAYRETASLLEKTEAKVLLCSSLFNCTRKSVAKAANNAGIPVVLWQHGIHGHVHHQTIKYQDFIGTDIEFVFGEGVVEFFKQGAKRFNTHLVAIGSSSLERLNLDQRNRSAIPRKNIGINSNKKVILYVTTCFCQNHLRSSLFSDNHYWKTQRVIMEVLGSCGKFITVVKLFPNLIYRESPLREYTKERGFKNCRFIRNEYSFVDLLPLADIIVIDISGTQCLLQALTTSKPIFVYAGYTRVHEKAQKLLKRRAYYYQELDDFLDALGNFLTGENIGTVNLNDKEFLKTYGIHKTDGKAGERAVQAIKKIVEGGGMWKNKRRKDNFSM